MSDTRSDTFKELRRKARNVRARPRRKQGGEGVSTAPQPTTSIDPLPSQNSNQKGLADSPAIAPVAPLPISSPPPEEQLWREAGEIDVVIYARPLNERLLLIRTDAGENARVKLHPDLRKCFSVGQRVWVRESGKPGMYDIAGHYNYRGRRCS